MHCREIEIELGPVGTSRTWPTTRLARRSNRGTGRWCVGEPMGAVRDLGGGRARSLPIQSFREHERRGCRGLLRKTGTTNSPAVMPMGRLAPRRRLSHRIRLARRHSGVHRPRRRAERVRAERVARNGDWEVLASERPRGIFSRSLVLGDNLGPRRIDAQYDQGALRLGIPVAEREAKQDRGQLRLNRARRHRSLTTSTAPPPPPDITHAEGGGASTSRQT